MKNVEFIIDGEIYLKKNPKVTDYSDLAEELKGIITDIEYDISKENPDFSMATKLGGYKHLLDRVEFHNGKLSYIDNIYFWQLSTQDGSTINMTRCEPYIGNPTVKYCSIEKLNRDYIKLSDFLEKAIFVGRSFRRTKPIIDIYEKQDNTYTDDSFASIINTQYIVLYAMQDLFLIKRKDAIHEDEYGLIDSRYTLDGNYEFFGPVYEEYNNKNRVYSEILEQISKYNKGRGRK